ncbi:ABC-2 type transport system ATP-binding protein [Ornithinimicrobium humiphilum]|uniref:ABC-2 type transport system ATP-binding protein n=1 Tax=Ornithinimicrobium humiphilum TaxID=125288 RepID=A0A543KJW8_9MICO|nr:ATP-binding cassette domain-containing protein [Ornithinimicrobium humiphilum]TQM95379.1 ABC-2 type transport system ATP-binding protein [Ornithinimicrobium humiphilum]
MLELSGLTRRYGDHLAVDDVSFTVPTGAMVGFVGGNGAGKTTTMRMVMGVLAPTAGEVRWQGRPVTAAERRRFGYMPEERGLYPKQPVLAQLTYLGQLHGMSALDARARSTELLERFGLGGRVKDKLETLSLGNQQRAQIIASVLGDPALLILDEPFSGLDPSAVDQMSALLREHTARGVPVLFSSHQLDLVDRLCDALVVLHQGRVVASGTSEQLRASAPLRYRLTTTGDTGWVRGVPGIEVVDLDGPTALVQPADEQVAERLLVDAVARGGVREFSRIVPSLSEIYREVAA